MAEEEQATDEPMPADEETRADEPMPADEETQAEEGKGAQEPEEARAPAHPFAPYAAYLLSWTTLAGMTAYMLAGIEQPVAEPVYPALAAGGVALSAISPLVWLVGWLVARSRNGAEDRTGLASSALLRTGVVAAAGAGLWLAALTLAVSVSFRG